MIHARGLTKRYGAATVLDDVTLAVEPGEMVAVTGPSGAGKSTLLRCLTRLVVPDEGELWVAGHAMHAVHGRGLAEARREIGLVFQHFNLVRRLTARDNVLAGRLGHAPLWRVLARRFSVEDQLIAQEALDRVGLCGRAMQRADTLSGGQQQRVAIARVLAQRSRVVLADEPVASLDSENAMAVLGLFREIARERGIAVLCVLHQTALARDWCDRVVELRAGRLGAAPGA